MKKSIILVLFALLTVSMSAQHVTPLNIQLTELNLDSLRKQYSGQAYLLELQRLDKLMKEDSKILNDAQKQLKAERNHHKKMMTFIEKAEAGYKNLQALAQKEIAEFDKLKDNTDKQLKDLNSSDELNQETRTKAVEQLQIQRRALEAMINATLNRQSQLANQPVQLQQMRTDFMVFNNEMTNKETGIKQMEATLKANRDVIKAEMKNVKAQK